MKRLYYITLILLVLPFGGRLMAQKTAGISIECSRVPIVVFLDGQRISSATHSCFIAYLPRGYYRLKVEIAPEYARRGEREIYNRSFFYSDNGIDRLDMDHYLSRGYRYDQDPLDDYNQTYPRRDGLVNSRGYALMPISVMTCNSYKQALERCSFKSDYVRVFDLLPQEAGLTAEQFKTLCRVPSFDSERTAIALILVPHILDIENCMDLDSLFSFASSRREVGEALKREFEARPRSYNRQVPDFPLIW